MPGFPGRAELVVHPEAFVTWRCPLKDSKECVLQKNQGAVLSSR